MLKKMRSSNLFLILITILVSGIFYSPYFINSIRGYQPELRFVGDLHLAGFPLFIQLGKYFSQYTYYGIDFFTANGSSSLFIRPNVPGYHPLQLILETIIRPTNNINSAKLFTFQLWLHGFLAMLFTSIWMRDVAKLGVYQALIGGTLFLGVVSYGYSQPSFFYIACLFPAFLYSLAYAFTRKTNLSQNILLSLPLVSIITAGYLPIAIMAVCIGIIATLLIPKINEFEYRTYKGLLITIVIGLVIVIFYLITTIKLVQIVPAIPKVPLIEALFFDQLALTLKGFLSIFSASITNDSGEAPHFRLGLPIVLLLYTGYQQLVRSGDRLKINIFVICILFFGVSLLLSFGRVSGLADMFFYSVPGLGGMHVYARYTIISVFFLIFALALGLSVTSLGTIDTKAPSFIIIIAILLITIYPEILTKNQITPIFLLIEILICLMVILVLKMRSDKALLLLIPLLLAHQGSFMYQSSNWATLENPGPSYKDVVNSPDRTRNLLNYFYSNSNKLLIKYIDITPEIEKAGGISQNFPWSIRYENGFLRRVSSYMGYDQGLSQQLEYAQKFSYFGKFDKKYLEDSGVDYIVYNSKTGVKEADWLEKVVDSQVPIYDMGNDFFVAKTKQLFKNNIEPHFSNGIFDIYSSAGSFDVKFFYTNWVSKIQLDYSSKESSILKFNLFPHKYWKYTIDDSEIFPVLNELGLVEITLPPGTHRLKINYSNFNNFAFLGIYFSYLLIITSIILYLFTLKIRRCFMTRKVAL